jgi:hypothetical protein
MRRTLTVHRLRVLVVEDDAMFVFGLRECWPISVMSASPRAESNHLHYDFQRRSSDGRSMT